MPALKNILVPLDGSPPSLAALEHAIALAEDHGAMIQVLTVIPGDDPQIVRSDDIDPAIDAAIYYARSMLGNRVSIRAQTGDAVRCIVDTAREGFDMIVMGTHGRVGRLRSLLGSVAEEVVRNAPCPVLTVRDGNSAYQSFAERRHGRPSLAEQTYR